LQYSLIQSLHSLLPLLSLTHPLKHLPFRLIAQCIDTTKKTGVIVTGAGLAGLAAATRLNSQNIPFLLLEASDAVGCRVWTDVVDGSCLERGFQIFIIAYREAQKLLDYKKPLDLQKSSRWYSKYYILCAHGCRRLSNFPLSKFKCTHGASTNGKK